MTNIPKLIASNEARWHQASIDPKRAAEVKKIAARLCAPSAKSRYQAISKATGVPWAIIAVIHEREASQRWDRQLGQGDPLGEVSVHKPRGRGPFFNHPDDPPGQDAFYRAAVDALTNCAPFAARWKDWTAGGSLTILVFYNGTGYEDFHHEASPYIWAATDCQEWGKYTSDGVYNPRIWDTQIGCAAMLKAMIAIDPSITFDPAPGGAATAPAS